MCFLKGRIFEDSFQPATVALTACVPAGPGERTLAAEVVDCEIAGIKLALDKPTPRERGAAKVAVPEDDSDKGGYIE